MQFYKYQSLGNNFILLDFLEEDPQNLSPSLLKALCDRNFGIGADGVLLLKSGPEGIIFNADGTPGELCINGIRCLAKHLFTKHGYEKSFYIKMGSIQALCSITENEKIKTVVDSATYVKKQSALNYKGHFVTAPNPHFIVFEKTTVSELCKNGALLQEVFSGGVNVEFVWQDKGTYNLLVYERGCGITMACGSGALAVITTLLKLGKIPSEKVVVLKMAGGSLECIVDEQNKVHIEGPATMVFSGSLPSKALSKKKAFAKTEKRC